MASRIDEFSATNEKLKRMSPTHNPSFNPNPISTSSNNLISHTTQPLSVSISDDTHPLSDKKQTSATPKKKKDPIFGGLSIFKKDKKEKDSKGILFWLFSLYPIHILTHTQHQGVLMKIHARTLYYPLPQAPRTNTSPAFKYYPLLVVTTSLSLVFPLSLSPPFCVFCKYYYLCPKHLVYSPSPSSVTLVITTIYALTSHVLLIIYFGGEAAFCDFTCVLHIDSNSLLSFTHNTQDQMGQWDQFPVMNLVVPHILMLWLVAQYLVFYLVVPLTDSPLVFSCVLCVPSPLQCARSLFIALSLAFSPSLLASSHYLLSLPLTLFILTMAIYPLIHIFLEILIVMGTPQLIDLQRMCISF